MSYAVAHLDYSSKHCYLALSTSRLFVCPLCLKCVLIAWQAGSFAVALCLLYIRHKTESPMSPSGNEHSTTDRPGNVQYEF